MNAVSYKRIVMMFVPLLSFLFLIGCAGMEFAPKKAVWYYPKELVNADKAVADAKHAGKNKKCPVEFNEAKDLKNKAYDTYLSCRTKEAIGMANDAAKKAKALCPTHPKKVEKVIDRMTLSVNFDFDKSNIRDVDKAELKKGINFIKKYPHSKIKLEGHTDSVGTEEYNQRLSERRASSTKEYFVTVGGIDAKRIKTAGYGETKPIASNKTKEGRAKNRRVEILILAD